MDASQPQNLLYFENFSPLCDYDGLRLVTIEPSMKEARLTISYYRGNTPLLLPMKLKDKRKSWATESTKKKAMEKESHLLLDSPNFSKEEY